MELRKCHVSFYENGEWTELDGFFHRWADDFTEEYHTTVPTTMALVELIGGRIIMVLPGKLRFTDK